ncbi:MAG: permease [Candidatus Jorgensenbacteria bacterium]
MFYPLELLAEWLTHDVFRIAPNTLLAGTVSFFIADIIKVFLLLAVIIFAVSVIRSFIPPEKVRAILSSKRKYLGHVLASFFGIFTPFCSCSAIPLFLGLVEAGVPLGVTFSFLISSPMINEVALVLLLGLFGWKIAFIYIGSGFLIAVFAGIFVGALKPEGLVEKFVFENKVSQTHEAGKINWSERLSYARTYTADILKKVWLYVVVGIGVGAWIHGFVPADFLAQYAGADKWYAVPLAVLIGIPLYSNAAGVIPLVSALSEKGVAMGTALALMMSVTALSFPEFMILKRVMKIKLILIFAGIVGAGIILTGYLFNWVLG